MQIRAFIDLAHFVREQILLAQNARSVTGHGCEEQDGFQSLSFAKVLEAEGAKRP